MFTLAVILSCSPHLWAIICSCHSLSAVLSHKPSLLLFMCVFFTGHTLFCLSNRTPPLTLTPGKLDCPGSTSGLWWGHNAQQDEESWNMGIWGTFHVHWDWGGSCCSLLMHGELKCYPENWRCYPENPIVVTREEYCKNQSHGDIQHWNGNWMNHNTKFRKCEHWWHSTRDVKPPHQMLQAGPKWAGVTWAARDLAVSCVSSRDTISVDEGAMGIINDCSKENNQRDNLTLVYLGKPNNLLVYLQQYG